MYMRAAQKAASLAASGAQVSVLSPTFCQELLREAEAGQVTLWHKAYEQGDLVGAFVVVAVASSQELVEEVWAETQQRGQLVNIVDVPAYCTFILPSILRREQLTIAFCPTHGEVVTAQVFSASWRIGMHARPVMLVHVAAPAFRTR